MPEKIKNDMVVSIDYKLYLEDEEMLEGSEAGDPLVYLHGYGNIIPGLEKALEGKAVGDEVEAIVQPEEGYGVYDKEGIMDVPKDELPEDLKPEEGMVLQISDKDGGVSLAEIIDVKDDGIVLDFNHPLAGETLRFVVKIVEIREADTEELSHGHVHQGGHHHH